jgi:hypothetical protein
MSDRRGIGVLRDPFTAKPFVLFYTTTRVDQARGSQTMTRPSLSEMSVEDLVERFTAIAVDQDKAIRVDDNVKFSRLFWQMDAVKQELKSRTGDQRRALLRLYGHPNMQVRLKAAKTLAVAPEAARGMLEAIADTGWFPQAGDAGMTLSALDDGTFIAT